MKKPKMQLLVIEPDEEPKVQIIDGSLKAMHRIVGGYIETMKFCNINGKRIIVVCNEEGKLLGLPKNMNIRGDSIVGTVFLCGDNEDELRGLTDDEVIKCKAILNLLKSANNIKMTANDTGISPAVNV